MNTAREWTQHLAMLLSHERTAMVGFLVALAEFDRERRWAELGHANLFSFLHRELGLSRGAAHYRKIAAGLVSRYPGIRAALADGRLCLTSVIELSNVVTPENCDDVVPRFFHCSKQEAKTVAAELSPNPAPMRDLLTAVARGPVRCTARDASLPLERADREVHPDERPATPPGCAVPRVVARPDPRRDVIEPRTADLRRLHVTVSRGFADKLAAARDALSHSHPNASLEQILEVALDLVLARHAKRRGLVAKPRKPVVPARNVAMPAEAAPRNAATDSTDARRASKRSAVPAAVRRGAWLRAGGRCEWELASGARCGETTRLELDHVVPVALGGPPTIDNVRVLCRGHNVLAARRVFGDGLVDRCVLAARPRRSTE